MNSTADPGDATPNALRALFARLEQGRKHRREVEPTWLFGIRETAIARVQRDGFPTRRDENWKYTNLAPVTSQRWHVAPAVNVGTIASQLDAAALPETTRLVLVNGHPVEELSMSPPSGVTASRIATLLHAPENGDAGRLRAVFDGSATAETAFSALNTAMVADGYAIDVEPATSVANPIHVVHLTAEGADSSPFIAQPRLSIVIARGARATIVETSVGSDEGRCLMNRVVDVTVGEGASLDHVLVQDDPSTTINVGMTRVRVGRDARYASTVLTFGGKLVRNDLTVVLEARGAHADLGGLYHVDGDQHVDNHTFIDHAVAHTTSRELYKGVLAGRSRGIFFGRILVRQDAQKINAVQTNNNLLLSDEALANSTPQLEIYADDVQCRHGSTIGQIDETALFYLRSRGVSDAAARELLTYAFANEVLDRVSIPALRDRLATRLTSVAID